MTQDWSKTDSGLACVLSAIVTAIAVILGVVYTWRKRQQTADAEPKVHVNWPTGDDPNDPFGLKDIAAESKRIAAERRAAGDESSDIMDFPFCPILTAAGTALAELPQGASCPFSAIKARQESRKSENAVTEGDSEGDEAVDDVISPELRDPVEFCSHIPAEVRKATQKVAMKKIEEDMSQEQKESERVIQREQLEAIFNLMADQEDKFGINTMDAMQDQMKLYSM